MDLLFFRCQTAESTTNSVCDYIEVLDVRHGECHVGQGVNIKLLYTGETCR